MTLHSRKLHVCRAIATIIVKLYTLRFVVEIQPAKSHTIKAPDLTHLWPSMSRDVMCTPRDRILFAVVASRARSHTTAITYDGVFRFRCVHLRSTWRTAARTNINIYELMKKINKRTYKLANMHAQAHKTKHVVPPDSQETRENNNE